MKAALEAKKAGKVRFFGFSGHRHPQTHLRMIGMYPWDCVQMKVDWELCRRYAMSLPVSTTICGMQTHGCSWQDAVLKAEA